jgi:hypothetical protein
MANATTGPLYSAPRADADPLPKTDLLRNVLNDTREMAREQLNAAWQIEVERAQEQLAAGWRGHVERVFEERFSELSARVEEEFGAAVESRVQTAVNDTRDRVRREVAGRLNQAMRRLRFFENEDQWSRALVDATEGFCERAALFIVNGPALRLQASRGVLSEAKIDNTPLESAPAFAGAVQSRDTIVALRRRGELSDAIADVLGEASEQRFYLFPIPVHERVAAVLYADSGSHGEDTAVTEALELMAVFASSVLEGQPEGPDRSKLVSIATGPQPAPTVALWFSLSKEEQELHLRAQRFARVQVAEMRLYKAQAVKTGRLERDLYAALREDVDRARDGFRKDYLSASPTMVDYVHLELLRTLANDDVELLGPEYPGPLV